MLKLLKSWIGEHDKRVDALVDGKADDDELAPPSDPRSSIRIGMLMLIVGVGGFLIWSVTAQLDEGVPAQGVISLDAKRKTVQHLTGGLVKELLVREAQVVKAGEPVIMLDDTLIRANHEANLQTFYSLKATEARLITEQSGAKSIAFPLELTTDPLHPLAVQHMQSQELLLSARRGALESDLRVLEESALTFEMQSKALHEQVGLLKQELAGVRDLAVEGYAPRNRVSEMERQFMELQSQTTRAQRGATEMKLRALQRRQDYRREVETQLAEIRRDAANAAERVRASREDLARTVIRSPVDGAVTGLNVFTVGGVVSPGAKLMDVVPIDDKLIFESRIASHLIDSVRVGLPADINLHNFPETPDLVVEGKVVSVSADLVADPNPNMPPYYLARIEVTPDGVKKLGKHHLQPGMPADMVIKTGERTLMTYLMKPLLRRLSSAMTES